MSEPPSTTDALREIQRWLAAAVLAGAPPAATEVDARLSARTPTVAIDRLGAYIGGYPARLREALAEAFPALQRVLGDARFGELVLRYLTEVPAGIYNLSDTGARFPEFLVSDAMGREQPHLPDLARLEWAVHTAFHAHERPPLEPDAFAGWKLEDFARTALEFQRSLAVVRSSWTVLGLWQQRYAAAGSGDAEIAARPQTIVVHREGFRVLCRLAEENEVEALDPLRRGRTLGQTMAELAGEGASGQSVTEAFARWMRAGLVIGYRLT